MPPSVETRWSREGDTAAIACLSRLLVPMSSDRRRRYKDAGQGSQLPRLISGDESSDQAMGGVLSQRIAANGKSHRSYIPNLQGSQAEAGPRSERVRRRARQSCQIDRDVRVISLFAFEGAGIDRAVLANVVGSEPPIKLVVVREVVHWPSRALDECPQEAAEDVRPGCIVAFLGLSVVLGV
jgi:hypothetical protein